MNIFFTADEHYGHKNIIKFCKRPYADMAEMTEALIANHNAVVKPGDLVYHLGDMFWRSWPEAGAIDMLHRCLNGNHYYIFGNHEELMLRSEALRSKFVWTRYRHRLSSIVGGTEHEIILDHFAGRVWHHSGHGSWQLYGHSHGELPDDPNLLAMDVGVDACGYTPISLEEVAQRMQAKSDAIKLRHEPRASDADAARLPAGS